jgi:hypothetical protein
MSTEIERIFSSARLLLTPQWNRLTDRSIEQLELLRNWIRQGITTSEYSSSNPPALPYRVSRKRKGHWPWSTTTTIWGGGSLTMVMSRRLGTMVGTRLLTSSHAPLQLLPNNKADTDNIQDEVLYSRGIRQDTSNQRCLPIAASNRLPLRHTGFNKAHPTLPSLHYTATR